MAGRRHHRLRRAAPRSTACSSTRPARPLLRPRSTARLTGDRTSLAGAGRTTRKLRRSPTELLARRGAPAGRGWRREIPATASRTRSPSCSPASRSTARYLPDRRASTWTRRCAEAAPRAGPTWPARSTALAAPAAPTPADELAVRFQQTHRRGDGQGRRGHRVLPVDPVRRAQRGRRRPGPVRACRRRSSTPRRPTGSGRWPAGDDHAVHPRHQARRGRPGPARRARRDARPSGPRRSAAGAAGAAARPRASATCSGRPSSAPGRSQRERLHGLRSRRRAREAGDVDQLGRPGRRRSRRRCTRPSSRCYDDPRPLRAELAAFAARIDPAGLVQLARPEAACSSTMPGRAGRLPGHRAVGPLAGRPGQPPAGRLRAARRELLRRLDERLAAAGRRRRARPSCWSRAGRCGCAGTGRSCSPATGRWPAHGPAAEHVVAFDRGGAVDGGHPAAGRAGAGRRLARHHRPGARRPTCSPAARTDGETRLADLLADYPVALLAP